MKRLIVIIVIILNMSVQAQSDLLVDSRDGKEYKTIQIGSKTWMAENLDYRPSLTFFGNVQDYSKANYYCYNNDTTNCDKYGVLYDIDALKNACPVGWHVPSKSEFDTLLKSFEGNRKKAFSGIIVGGTLGFDASLGGYFNRRGYCEDINKIGQYWSSTQENKYHFTSLMVNKVISTAYISNELNSCALSVRCVKD